VMGRVRGVEPQRAREREARPAVEKERGGEVGRCGLAGPKREERERRWV
jgi:hypothetical protein